MSSVSSVPVASSEPSVSGVIAAAASETRPLPGQDHRSGPNFTLILNNGNPIILACPQGVVIDIKEDIRFAVDPTPVSSATNGTVIPASALATGKNYYVANPRNATTDFAVILSQG